MKEVLSFSEAVAHIHDGASLMVGGFMCCGNAYGLIDALLQRGVGELTLITNDGGFPERGVGKLIVASRVAHLIASHIGTNPVAGQKMNDGSMKVELVPQGTLAERIRCAGAGLGGVLTPTGLGTAVEKGKRKVRLDGRVFLLDTPVTADFAFVKAAVCDRLGNAFVEKACKNFSVVMAMAAKHCIVEADEVVEVGELDPEKVHIPAVFVDAIACERRP
jgi:acetate CoA/acetoacetate CoA-transferase alpha subunit